MSRIGKKPIAVPDGVTVRIDGRQITVEGPKGKLEYRHRPEVEVVLEEEGKKVRVQARDAERATRAYHGLTRALSQNMVTGVAKGYEKRLEIRGVGYLANVDGDTLELRVGFANELHKKIPSGLEVTCPSQTEIVITGCDKQLVGQFAAEVRALRKPEPYKGKGIRYKGEHVKIKQGKATT